MGTISLGGSCVLVPLFIVLTMIDGRSAFLMDQQRFTSTIQSASGRRGEFLLMTDGEEYDTSSSTVSRRNLFATTTTTLMTFGTIALTTPSPASARLEGVNNPNLLPNEKGLNVIQVEKFLTSGQVKRLDTLLSNLERDSGYRVRVLCQAYPNTPGLAIRDYWDLGYEGQKDDKYIVMIVDQFGGKGNALNFNVGEGVKLALPNVFWSRLQAKYGTTFYIRDYGIDVAITNAIEAIASCLRSEDQYCTNVPDASPSFRSLGFTS